MSFKPLLIILSFLSVSARGQYFQISLQNKVDTLLPGTSIQYPVTVQNAPNFSSSIFFELKPIACFSGVITIAKNLIVKPYIDQSLKIQIPNNHQEGIYKVILRAYNGPAESLDTLTFYVGNLAYSNWKSYHAGNSSVSNSVRSVKADLKDWIWYQGGFGPDPVKNSGFYDKRGWKGFTKDGYSEFSSCGEVTQTVKIPVSPPFMGGSPNYFNYVPANGSKKRNFLFYADSIVITDTNFNYINALTKGGYKAFNNNSKGGFNAIRLDCSDKDYYFVEYGESLIKERKMNAPFKSNIDFAFENDSTVWFATEIGVVKWSNGFWDVFNETTNAGFEGRQYRKLAAKNGVVYVYVTYNGLYRIEANEITKMTIAEGTYTYDYQLPEKLEFDSEGNLWVAMSGSAHQTYEHNATGIYCYKNNQWYMANAAVSDFPEDFVSEGVGYYQKNSVLDLTFDSKGILWLATSGNGIVRFDPKKSFKNSMVPYFDQIITGNDIAVSSTSGLKIYPNPSSANVVLSSSEEGLVTIRDEYSQIVHTCAIVKGENLLDVADLKTGMYFVSTQTSKSHTVIKLNLRH